MSHSVVGVEVSVTRASTGVRAISISIFFLRPDLLVSQRCTEGQTWPSVRRGIWTGATFEKHTRCTPRTLTTLGGGPWPQQLGACRICNSFSWRSLQ